MSSSRCPSPRVLAALGAGVVLLLLVVVLLAGTGSDDEAPEITEGASTAGFPLRGDRAQDDAMIRDAADAWIQKARREDDDWLPSDGAPEITALWAGRTGDGDGVVLASRRDAAVLHRREGREYWSISDAQIEEDDDPRIVVSAAGVLVGDRSAARFRPSSGTDQGYPALRNDDGLWHRGSTNLLDGALVLADGLPGRYATRDLAPAAVFTGSDPVVRTLSPALLERLDGGPESRPSAAARRLGEAARAAGPDPDTPAGRREVTSPATAPRIDLVSDADLGPFGPVTVLHVRRSAGPGGGSVVATSGGSSSARDDDVAVLLRSGGENGLRQVGGPALDAAYVRRGTRSDTPEQLQPTYLLVAGDRDVARSEVLAGRRSVTIDGPVGLVRATWVRPTSTGPRDDTDVIIIGRTARGAVVAPSAVDPSVVLVDEE